MRKRTVTERTVRGETYWVKIQRDAAAKRFLFSLGFNGEPKAINTAAMPFRYVPTWPDAESLASAMMNR